MPVDLNTLTNDYTGEWYFDDSVKHRTIRIAYSTDASVYQEMPLAVAIPKNAADIRHLIDFARANQLTLVPRTAGTSLAGQVVSHGVIVDVSKYLNAVLELNAQEKWVRVQPGVVRDDLNAWLKPHGLMFAPETSTSSRAMIGGMIGNNSCGLHSMVWGNTRNNLLEVTTLLADGSEAVFGPLDLATARQKRTAVPGSAAPAPTPIPDTRPAAAPGLAPGPLEAHIYAGILSLIEAPANRAFIAKNFPKPTVTRRNSGYALDHLAAQHDNGQLDLSGLIAGSEGTLCFITEAKLKLIDLPPKEVGMVAVHFNSLHEALKANLIIVHSGCSASELVDHIILEQAIKNPEQAQNRFFLVGKPGAILMVEFFDATPEGLQAKCTGLISDLQAAGLGYAYPILTGSQTRNAWDLRRAGLGLLRNLKGDAQPVNLIEDCAVAVEDLPDYIADLEALLQKHGTAYSMYAHAGDGELHVEPMVNLKTVEGQQLFRTILTETAAIIKKYNGSLSGEHGDGRLRGNYIPAVMGPEVYELFTQVKHLFDEHGLFNKGKITDTPDMLANLRYEAQPTATQPPASPSAHPLRAAGPQPPHVHPPAAAGHPAAATMFDFSAEESMLRLTEKCSGSGDCRKTHITGGTMCPSYMATRNENDTTRARANVLRQYLDKKPGGNFGASLGNAADDATATVKSDAQSVKSDAATVKEVLDLCLACKGCQTECPSSVDISKLRAEFLHHYYQSHGTPFRTKLIGNFSRQMKLASGLAPLYNVFIRTPLFRRTLNNLVGFHPDRSLPPVAGETLKAWHQKRQAFAGQAAPARSVYLFCDEFTNYNDVEVGKKTILLLEKLGYSVLIPDHADSGRSYLSKGLLKEARACAEENVEALYEKITAETPLIGIEPSAILGFRDEYKTLVKEALKPKARSLSQHVYLFEEWFHNEIVAGRIDQDSFTGEKKRVILHGHCHQKALSDLGVANAILSLPKNFTVHTLPTGCCGMAGSFGYEKEHYDVSMKIGGLVLFPSIEKEPETTIIAAAGTSCRHQIKDGVHRKAQHPAEILFDALV
ncbi:MAG TPA: FAD-linked oxidase C-terminal domain-containing protein [Puia sp.]|nr:FAD-linked oxidase C-terminal domain-containing protein [Puia sp.]